MRYSRRISTTRASRSDPVFVDRTGRRRRLTVLIGTGAGTVLVASLVALFAGLLGGSPTAIPDWPTGGGQHRSDRGVVTEEVAATHGPS
ncbi:hypothetical protein ACFQ0D_35730, partial [Micromonospora zhanjiangensis]